jgi:O-antigen/teichoic acid export membrane protein
MSKDVVLTLADRYIGAVTTIGSSVVLARMLAPDEVGVASLAFAFVAIAHIFRDMGLTTYVMSQSKIDAQDLRQCLGLALILGILLAIALLLVSYPAAKLYGDERIGQACRGIAINFLVLPFGSVISAYMARKSLMSRLQSINIIGSLVLAGTMIMFARYGAGHMSAIYAANCSIGLHVLLCVIFRPSDFPAMPSFRGLLRLVSVNSWTIGLNFVTLFGQRFPELGLAKTGGLAISAFFEKAFTGTFMPQRFLWDGLCYVLYPRLRVLVPRTETFDQALINSLAVLFAGAALTSITLAFCAQPLILLLFGEAWVPSVGALQILAFTGMLATFNLILQQALQLHENYKFPLQVTLVSRGALIVMFFVGLSNSLLFVSLAFVISEAVLSVGLFFHGRFKLMRGLILQAVWKGLLCACVAVFLAWFVLNSIWVTRQFGHFPELLLRGTTAVVFWVILSTGLNRKIWAQGTWLMQLLKSSPQNLSTG